MRRGRWAMVACVLVGLAACGGSSASTDRDESSANAASSAAITDFRVPEHVSCAPGVTSVNVKITYVTTGSESTLLSVDGRQITDLEESGALDVPVHCDPLPHTFVLVVEDADGNTASNDRVLVTDLPAS